MDITQAFAGERVTIDGQDFKVEPVCPEKHDGHWICLTHVEAFENNFQKDVHTFAQKPCKFVWICHQHGPEQAI